MDSKEVWGCFLVSGVRMVYFLKIDENSFKSTNTNMAFKQHVCLFDIILSDCPKFHFNGHSI